MTNAKRLARTERPCKFRQCFLGHVGRSLWKTSGLDKERMATPGNKLTRDAAYKVNIPLYEGPLDLLLDLIKKQEMNIHDIQISLITAQYLEYLHKLEELDIDVSADFIYMAATLILIKSKMLLPPDPLGGPEEQIDPRA